jgi:hypothetical protein
MLSSARLTGVDARNTASLTNNADPSIIDDSFYREFSQQFVTWCGVIRAETEMEAHPGMESHDHFKSEVFSRSLVRH